MLEIELTKDIEDRLEALAIRTGQTKNFCIREAILEYLDDMEDVHLAEQRLEDIRSGRSKTVPLEELIRE